MLEKYAAWLIGQAWYVKAVIFTAAAVVSLYSGGIAAGVSYDRWQRPKKEG